MPARAPHEPPEPDPVTWCALAFRVLDQSRRTANLVALVLTILLPIVGVAAELIAAGRIVGTWSITGLLSGIGAPVALGLGRWLLRRYTRADDDDTHSDLGKTVSHGHAEHPAAPPPTPPAARDPQSADTTGGATADEGPDNEGPDDDPSGGASPPA